MSFGNLSVAELVACGVSPTAAKAFQPFLARDLPAFDINSNERVAGFIGQIMVESRGFTVLEENLWYTTPARIAAVWPGRFRGAAAAAAYVRNPARLANRVYAGRLGNGPEESGDGWRFRGRGLKQLTGRANYAAAARELGRPYVDYPGLVQEREDAVKTACWYWRSNRCNALADARDWDAITRRVNGPAMLQAAARRRATMRALEALS